MREIEFFTFASQEYFEPLSQYPAGLRYWHLVKDLIPEDWTAERFEIWLLAKPPGYKTIGQGFKIHLSATLLNDEEILRRVVPELVREGVSFKLTADPELLWLVNSKNYNRGSSGKFLVAYPQTLDQFTSLIERLYTLTRGLEGPYILSDRRYKDGKIVYYRYGSFKDLGVLAADGKKVFCLRSPDGELVPDERLPSFKLPPWVSDPFPPAASTGGPKEPVLNGRYRIESVLSFSNAGGVYRARDQQTGQAVVIKEARPWTCVWLLKDKSGYVDAPKIHEKEFRLLRRLDDLPYVPKAIDLFHEWEHLFLVEELVDGVPLTRYRAADDFVLVCQTGRQGRVRRFCQAFQRIALNLVRMLREIHGRRIVVGDLSPNNILIDRETQALRLVDLESAVDLEALERGEPLVSTTYTPGFRLAGRIGTPELGPEDDFYAAGMTLYSMLLPIQSFFRSKPQGTELFLEEIGRYVNLPSEVGQVIRALLAGDGEEAGRVLEHWNVDRSLRVCRRQARARQEPSWEERRAALDRRLQQTLEGIASHLLSTYDAARSDRLWPGDLEVFRTNPLSLAYGAGGPLLLLHDLGHSLPREVEEWLLSRKLNHERYPPGLFLGLAGIAQVAAELGYEEMAEVALEASWRSPLLFSAADYFQGAAGWGMAQLWFFERSRKPEHLHRACEAGERILAAAERRSRGLCWRNPIDRQVHFGLAHGTSGIALFLLSLHHASREERFRAAAEAAIRFERSQASPRGQALRWRNHESAGEVFEPYWRHGSAGVASVLIRFHALLGEPRYRKLAERAASYAADSKFAVQPSQFEGLSGIGEMALDLYLFTGEERFLRIAYELAESILLYAVERAEGIAFPGRRLVRLSNDYGTGSAGVGLFFHRLLHPGPRRFHDIGAAAQPVAPVLAEEPAIALPG